MSVIVNKTERKVSVVVKKAADGKDFKYEDFTPEQLEALKLKFEDLSPEDKEELALKFEDLTPEQIELLEAKVTAENIEEALGYSPVAGTDVIKASGNSKIEGVDDTLGTPPLAVSTYNDVTEWSPDVLGHHYYPLVAASEDAALGLISINEGGHGSGIDLMEVIAGILQDKWWIGRMSTTHGSNLQITHGSNADYTLNNRIFDLTPDYKLLLPNNTDSKLLVRATESQGDFAIESNGDVYIYPGKKIQAGVSNSNQILVYNGANAAMIFTTTYGNSSIGGYVFNAGGVTRFKIVGNGNVLIGTTTDNGTDKLQVNGSANFTGVVTTGRGTTRPTTGLSLGSQFFDTTLGKPIWYNGSAWVDAMGTVV